ncbi:hypothetical protein [Ammoniphilus resinae]|uniref:Lipoprotein n=1 Tax=Ammoniphilus resinae TaxID=861532 RepID=A0ABS4GWM5_9BACL|nr:hypothetical protein [Ammoniphilus resinae]MBP1934667.1 hypothetical protein [Ammoniphilus resinae]
MKRIYYSLGVACLCISGILFMVDSTVTSEGAEEILAEQTMIPQQPVSEPTEIVLASEATEKEVAPVEEPVTPAPVTKKSDPAPFQDQTSQTPPQAASVAAKPISEQKPADPIAADLEQFVAMANQVDWLAAPTDIYNQVFPIAQRLQRELMRHPGEYSSLFMDIGAVVGSCSGIEFHTQSGAPDHFMQGMVEGLKYDVKVASNNIQAYLEQK